jgi:hypothetical protein
MGPFYHDTASSPVAMDEWGGLQVWKVAVYILNEQLLRADKGRSSCLRVWRRAETPRRKKIILLLSVTKALVFELFLYTFG